MDVIEVGVLGDLEVSADGRPVRLTTGRLRTLLAMLAMSAGETVSLDRLASAVWSDKPPDNTRRSLQTYVSRLRTAVGEALIETRSAGLVLHVNPDNVDALRFVRLLDRASHELDADGERRLLDAALGLWRGEPFSGVSSRWLAETEAPRLTERHLAALERRIDLDLADGRHSELVARLTTLTARYPLREPLWVRLLVALERCGRQAEALEQYEQVRTRIADELGVDPGPELRGIHADLLAGQPAAAVVTPPVATEAGRPQRRVPRQLPADLATFVGRRSELADLGRLAATARVVIAAIDGMAGVGKTALAVQAAHRLANRYPDGQLFLNLHGFTEGVAPVDPGEALDRLLRALGVPAGEIPADIDDRAARYRSQLAGMRVLILLDNAADEAQITPLLPGVPGCLVLVTSRRRLLGLDQAHPVSLDVLPLAEAVALFVQTVGEHRIGAADAGPVTEVVQLCGRLPLAIRVGAARLRARPIRTVAHLAGRLRDQQHRLAELEAGQRSVTAALDLSYLQLPPELRRAYRLLGLNPGADLAPVAAGALFDLPAPVARRLLDRLVDDHLLQEHAAGRYRMHDLIRHHAKHRAGKDQPAAAGEAALARLFAHCAASARAAVDAAYPDERDRRPRPAQPTAAAPGLADPHQATAWLDTELGNLLATALHAAEHGRPDHTLHLSATLDYHLLIRGRFTSAGTLHRRALDIARRAGDERAELPPRLCLGDMFRQQGRHDRATENYQRALEIARATGSHADQLDALSGLGDVRYRQGRYDEAMECFETALGLARQVDDRTGELAALRGLGWAHRMLKRPARAAGYLAQAMEVAREAGNRTGEFFALTGLGHLHLAQQGYSPAEGYFRQALDVARESGQPAETQSALYGLGHIHLAHRRHRQAEQNYQEVLRLAQETGNRNWQFEALHALGRLYLAIGRPTDAVACQTNALDIAAELGQRGDQARAHDGLACAYYTRDDLDLAGKHWQQALDLLVVLGLDQTEDGMASTRDIRSRLARLTAE